MMDSTALRRGLRREVLFGTNVSLDSVTGRIGASRTDERMYGPGMVSQYLYHFGPGSRPELATEPSAWTTEDEAVGAAHYSYLSQALEEGIVILAGRSQDGIGPAIVIFEADGDEDARRFMEEDPFVSQGLFTATLHPFNAALMQGQ